MKKCTRCNIKKKIADFDTAKRTYNICRSCRKEARGGGYRKEAMQKPTMKPRGSWRTWATKRGTVHLHSTQALCE